MWFNKIPMESEPNDESEQPSSQSQGGSEPTPKSKLRDLRPEKDPMGAGISGASQNGSAFSFKQP